MTVPWHCHGGCRCSYIEGSALVRVQRGKPCNSAQEALPPPRLARPIDLNSNSNIEGTYLASTHCVNFSIPRCHHPDKAKHDQSGGALRSNWLTLVENNVQGVCTALLSERGPGATRNRSCLLYRLQTLEFVRYYRTIIRFPTV